jgi:hypothetical protein
VGNRVWALVAVVFVAVMILGVLFAPSLRTCYYDGYSGPAWVYEEHKDDDPAYAYCDAALWEYLLPWHWGAEDICIERCLQS